MTAFAYVFGHSQERIGTNPEDQLRSLAEDARSEEGVWSHSQKAGDPAGGYVIVVAYKGELWGEFEVSKKTGPEIDPDGNPWYYYARPGSVYLYNPRRPYADLVGQVHFAQGIDRADYTKFLKTVRRTRL